MGAAIDIRGAIARRLLSLPGGVGLLAGVRRLFRFGRDAARFVRNPAAEVRRRRDRTGWPWTDQDRAILTNRVDEDRPILSSNRLAGRCRYVFEQGGSLIVHEDMDNDWYFCRTADIHEFFATVAPEHEFVFLTGHTDLPVDHTHRRYLKRSGLKVWFAMNAMLKHPKVKARPFGLGALATPEETATLQQVQERNLPKRELFHNQFMLERNPFERAYCLQQTGLPLGRWVPWPEYLEEVASSYFCISPIGIGIDCVRTWEALLLRSIPVVRRTMVTDHHPDFPMIVLDDWSEFRSIDFSPELYEQTWKDWDPDELLLDRYVQRIERILQSMDDRRSSGTTQASPMTL
jgi:hypothetical protein